MILLAMAASFGFCALGILLIVLRPRFRRQASRGVVRWNALRTLVLPALIGTLGWWLSGFVAVGLVALVASFLLVRKGTQHRPLRDERLFVDALATWTEQLRDTLAGSHGLEEAIFATAERAPRTIQPEVQRLVAYMTYGSTAQGLRQFADDLDHPTADFVVSALLTATQYQARDLVTLLSHVADCARDEGKMRSRVWVSRARTRSSVRIIIGVVVVFVGGLFIFSADYLSPYSSLNGQVFLTCIGVVFATSFALMKRMSEVVMPERFVKKRVAG